MISVIVPTYQEEKNIGRCLEHLSHQTVPREDYEIIVVDGGSWDRTREIASRYADRVIVQHSRGVGGARNDGIKIAKGEIIATTDADAIVPENWLEKLQSKFMQKNVVGACGPNYPVEKKIRGILAFGMIKAIHTTFSHLGIPGMPGNNSAFLKDVFHRIGGYSTEITYLDDMDFCLRLRKEGRIIYDPNLIVWVSTRRMDEDGYLRTMLLWLKGDILLLAGKRERMKERYFRKDK